MQRLTRKLQSRPFCQTIIFLLIFPKYSSIWRESFWGKTDLYLQIDTDLSCYDITNLQKRHNFSTWKEDGILIHLYQGSVCVSCQEANRTVFRLCTATAVQNNTGITGIGYIWQCSYKTVFTKAGRGLLDCSPWIVVCWPLSDFIKPWHLEIERNLPISYLDVFYRKSEEIIKHKIVSLQLATSGMATPS